MEEMFENIIEKIEFKKKEMFSDHIRKCIHISKDSSKSSYAVHENLIFKMDAFFKGFINFQNEFGRDKKYIAATHALGIICEELGIDVDKEELFMLYHIRDIGKFRKREKDLHAELKKLWSAYPYTDFALADQDFSYGIKNLMRNKFIDYRKGNLQLNQSIIIRYRTGLDR